MAPSRTEDALLLLEDGSLFTGRAVAPGTRFGEVVFNTAMTGYQEVLTDPSYRGQIVVMTQPHIGNYGVDSDVAESGRPWVEGFVARRFTAEPSNHTSEEALPGYLGRHGIPALDGIDTRALVRRLRERGAAKGVITTERTDIDGLLAELADFPSMTGRALVDEVTPGAERRIAAVGVDRPRFRLAVWDFGC
jgi:carbamoyl-phosphate synthase small subunit